MKLQQLQDFVATMKEEIPDEMGDIIGFQVAILCRKGAVVGGHSEGDSIKDVMGNFVRKVKDYVRSEIDLDEPKPKIEGRSESILSILKLIMEIEMAKDELKAVKEAKKEDA